MSIKTKRLLLRDFTLADARRLTELIAQPEIISMLEKPPWPYGLADAQLWLRALPERKRRNEAHAFAIDLSDIGLIGGVSLQKKDSDVFSLGYWLGRRFWGNGYASEAARGIMNWAMDELELKQANAGYFADNPASGKLLSKLGFVATGKSCPINNPLRKQPIACLEMKWSGY